MDEEKQSKKDKKVQLIEVVKETALAFQLPNEEQVDANGLLIFIANKLIELEKKL